MKPCIKILLAVIILTTTIGLKAQIGNIKISVKGGGNISNAGGEDIEYNSKLGFCFVK